MTFVTDPLTRTASPVPLVDLQVQHRQVAAEIEEGWARVVAEGSFVGGPDVGAFEEEFARFSGARHCVGVANGTDALELALRARGVGPGDEVIVPANTFVATAEAVSRTGADPVLVDCDDDHLLVDPAAVAARVGPRTRAVMPVHLYGQMAPLAALADAVPTGVVLIEDAAQSQGATQHGRPSGSVGVAAGTSFYPGKNLGAYGDAGAVLTVRRGDRRDGAGARRPRRHPEVRPRPGRLQLPARHAAGGRPAGEAAPPGRVERAAAGRRAPLRRPAVGRRGRAPPGDGAGQRARVAPVRGAGRRARPRCWPDSSRRASAPASTTRCRCTSPGVRPPRPAGASSRSPRRRRARLLSLPLFPGITAAQQERVVEVLTAAVAEGRP